MLDDTQRRLLMLLIDRVNQLIQAADESDEAAVIEIATRHGAKLRYEFAAKIEHDGPLAGDRFRFRGKTAVLARLQWRIANTLWEEREISREELIRRAWDGREMPQSKGAFSNAIRRLNDCFQEAGIPLLVTCERGGVVRLITPVD